MPVVSEWAMEWTRLLILNLGPGESYAHTCGESEWIVLPLTGACEIRCAEPSPTPPLPEFGGTAPGPPPRGSVPDSAPQTPAGLKSPAAPSSPAAAHPQPDAGHDPADSGRNPADSGRNPADSGRNPADAGEDPAVGGQNPADLGHNPADLGHNPADLGHNPAGSGHNPAPPAFEERGPGRSPAGSGPQVFRLRGRRGVFDGPTDFAYLPRDGSAEVTSPAGGRFALVGARCERRLPARYGPAAEVPVELRGAGPCSRQVNNFAAAGVFDCDRLIAVEVLTPGGNWSSYPPHKHDEHHPGVESRLEEIYYYEIAPHGDTPGLGYQRVSPSPAGKTDILTEVRTGDAVLIPDGWHGPSIAAPGHDMYYLNVMAGPGATREWLIRDHPDHGWIRSTWTGQDIDPRLPFPYRAEDPA